MVSFQLSALVSYVKEPLEIERSFVPNDRSFAEYYVVPPRGEAPTLQRNALNWQSRMLHTRRSIVEAACSDGGVT